MKKVVPMFGKFVFSVLFLAPGVSFAESWSGVLVDSACYESLQRNVNPTDTLTSVDRNTNDQVRYCSPNLKTRHFTIVEPVGTSYRLDAAGDAKSAELVRKVGKLAPFPVEITGERKGSTIKVDSVSKPK